MKIKSIKDDEVEFDNGYILKSYHIQDCCESVFADFEVLNTYNVSTVTGKKINIRKINFEENLEKLVQGVAGAGFNMISKKGEKFFIPCYNQQNGYYSSKLELILSEQTIRERIDISEFVEDQIED